MVVGYNFGKLLFKGGISMKITFLTLGSRGDVQPYTALAKELIKNGHQAAICTGASFEKFIQENNIAFHEAEADLMGILESEEGKKIFNGGRFNLSKMLKFTKTVIGPAYRKSMDDFLEAARGSDLIVYHPKALGAADIAEYLNIPCICMPPVPIIYPITEIPNLAVSASKDFGPFLNKLTYKIAAFGESPFMKAINEFRNTSLKLPKRKVGERTYSIQGKPIPILYPISPFLFKEVESWKDRVFLTGFLFLEENQAVLGEELEDFLARGKRPIVISFSSMPLQDPDSFKDKLVKALKETNNRAVILTGASGMHFEKDEDIFILVKASHRLLFKEAKGIIHHGGVGTMAEALLSGVPQLMIPFTADQPFWANRLHNQGYALSPITEKNSTVSALAHAFKEMENEKYIRNAKTIQAVIETENGLKNAVKYIENFRR
jgi:sterol 3beta-glucosyltransferase